MGNKILFRCDPSKNTVCDKAKECWKEPGCFGCWYTEYREYATLNMVGGREIPNRVIDEFVKITKYDGVDHALDELKQASEKDNVNHPAHYETEKFECIDVMIETQGKEKVKAFCICNAFKYLYRHGRKNSREDIEKAVWYLNKYLELEETYEVKKK